MKEELHFETLKGNKKKYIIVLFAFILFGIIFFNTSKAKYKVTESMNIAKGTVNYTLADMNLVAVYQENDSGEYESVDEVPTSGYSLNSEESYCIVNNVKLDSVTIEYSNGLININGLSKKGTKCYAYFDIIKDATAPTISNVSSSVTKTTIAVTVTASDDTGVSKYYYSIDNGSYTNTTSNTYTFSGLSAGSTHTIKVYVTDAAGNESSVTSKSITTTPDGQTVDSILAGMTKSTRTDFSAVLTTSTTKTVYSATDDDGTSYYYAGAPTDNWVKFAGFYWRIIRFNGDGSIRLIYNGTSTTTTGTGTQLSSTSAFNSSYDNNAYVGLKYTTGSLRGTGTKSTILGALESFYTSSLSSYASYLDTNAGFCGDRTPSTSSSSSNGSGGTGTTTTYYGAYIRLYKNKAPVLTCANSSDLYTTSSSTKGNKSLTYPVGLITADEVAYAGGVYATDNTSFYLYNNQYYWTLSPADFNGSTARVFYVVEDGWLYNYYNVYSTFGVRPVINLKTGTLFTTGSDGTSSNPYEVIM